MIDIEKFICSLLADHPVGVTVREDIHKALKDQGLEYKGGKIVPIEDKATLKESEDERIKNFLMMIIDKYAGISNEEKKKCLAWLEKQGEHQKFRDSIQVGDKVTRNEDGVLVNLSQLNRVAKKQGEQKPADTEKGANGNEREIPIPEPPLTIKHAKEVMGIKQNDAWSKEDEEHIMAIDLAVNRCDGKWNCCGEKCPISEHNPWLKSLKERVQPKQEWSEEDEYCRHQLIVFCENCMVKDDGAKRCAHWLKSFKERYTWKPSDEQMDALLVKIPIENSCNKVDNILKSLYSDLKRLK